MEAERLSRLLLSSLRNAVASNLRVQVFSFDVLLCMLFGFACTLNCTQFARVVNRSNSAESGWVGFCKNIFCAVNFSFYIFFINLVFNGVVYIYFVISANSFVVCYTFGFIEPESITYCYVLPFTYLF